MVYYVCRESTENIIKRFGYRIGEYFVILTEIMTIGKLLEQLHKWKPRTSDQKVVLKTASNSVLGHSQAPKLVKNLIEDVRNLAKCTRNIYFVHYKKKAK